jgi:hypothetical protein
MHVPESGVIYVEFYNIMNRDRTVFGKRILKVPVGAKKSDPLKVGIGFR